MVKQNVIYLHDGRLLGHKKYALVHTWMNLANSVLLKEAHHKLLHVVGHHILYDSIFMKCPE